VSQSASLRRAGPSDRELLMSMIEAFCAEDQHPFDADRVLPALLPLLEDDHYGVVWLIGEPVLGYAVVTWSYSLESGGREALLDEIYMAERNRGLGALAVQELLADLARRGIRRIFLETESWNERVRRFYARQGFIVEDSTWMARDVPQAD